MNRQETIEEKITPDLLNDTSQMHYIGLMLPPRFGVHLYATILELTFFPPGTEKNGLFTMRLMKWKGKLKDEMIWNIISIPKEYETHAKVCINKAGLKTVRAVPVVFEVPTGMSKYPWAPSVAAVSDLNNLKRHPLTAQARNIQKFPCDGKTVFTLENEDDHPAYKHPTAFKQLLNIEAQLCDKLHKTTTVHGNEETIDEELNTINKILNR